MWSAGCRVWDAGCGAWGLGPGFEDLVFVCLVLRLYGSALGLEGLGFRPYGLGF